MSEMDAQQPTLFKQKAGIKSRLNDIPRLCKEIMLAQQSGSTEDVSAMSGLTVALQSIDWKNQYVWSYAWEAIDDMDVDLANEGRSYYDAGSCHSFYPRKTCVSFFDSCPVSNKWIREKSPNHTPSVSSHGSRVSTAGAELEAECESSTFEVDIDIDHDDIREAIQGFRDEK